VNLPSFPTDNLYKFIALAGLTLFIVCFLYPSISIQPVLKRSTDLAATSAKMAIDAKAGQEKSERDRKTVLNAPQSNLQQAEQLYEEDRKLLAEQEKSGAQFKYDEQFLEAEVGLFQHYQSLCSVGQVVGLAVCACGFIFWYFKLQRHQDRAIAQEVTNTVQK
jgi:hypothetical protein